VQKFKYVIGPLPPVEVVIVMNENRKMYYKMNHLREEKNAHTQQVDALEEEEYRVTMTLTTTQEIIK
jgi:hypothetical protein